MFKPYLRLLSVGIKLFRLRFLHQEDDKVLARQAIANGLAEAGGIAMKLGQIVADVGKTEGYDRLLVKGHARPLSEMLPVLEAELHKPVAQIFSSIDEEASAASLGQVHRACLLSGEQVAVKIQYPAISNAVKSELKLAGLLPGIGPVKKWGIDMDAYRQALTGNMQRELDYSSEADRQNFMRGALHVDGLIVPEIYSEYCSQRVLVQSWEEGVLLDQALNWAATEKMLLGRTLLMTLFQSLFQIGEVHGDPHMGNLFYRRTEHKPEIVLLDYGCTIAISQNARHALLKLILDTREGKSDQVLACFVALGFDAKKLSYIAEEMGLMTQILFQPFLTDEPFDPQSWQIKLPFEHILGEKKWWFRSAGPADLFLIMRAFQGVIRQLSRLEVNLPWWPLLIKSITQTDMDAAESYQPEPFPTELIDQIDTVSSISKNLKVQISPADGSPDLSLSLPALAVLELENVIPESILSKISGSGDFDINQLKQQVLESKLKPQILFDAKQNGATYRVWLE